MSIQKSLHRITFNLKLAPALLMILVVVTVSSNAQSSTYTQSIDSKFVRSTRNYSHFDVYTTKDGSVLKAGSRLMLGQPSDDTPVTFYTPDGKPTTDMAYTYYFAGRLGVATRLEDELDRVHPPKKWLGQQDEVFIVTSFMAVKGRGSKSRTLLVYVTGIAEGTNQYRTIKDLERALEVGEIIDPNNQTTKD